MACLVAQSADAAAELAAEDLLDDAAGLLEAGVDDLPEHVAAVAASASPALALQHRELLRHVRAADARAARRARRAYAAAVAQVVHDLMPRGVGQGREHGGVDGVALSVDRLMAPLLPSFAISQHGNYSGPDDRRHPDDQTARERNSTHGHGDLLSWRQARVRGLRRFTIETDQPAQGGGDGSAPAPFDLFLASIGTCAGIFALGFMQQRGIDPRGRQAHHARRNSTPTAASSARSNCSSSCPADFPEKYRDAIVNAMKLCTVKKHLQQPPFAITRSRPTRSPPDGRSVRTRQHARPPRGPGAPAALPPEQVVALLRLTGDETVVDYGAGTGMYTVAVARRCRAARCLAVEALPQLVELLRAQLMPELDRRARADRRDRRQHRPVADGVGRPRRAWSTCCTTCTTRRMRSSRCCACCVRAAGSSSSTGATLSARSGRRPGTLLGLAAARAVIAAPGCDELEAHEAGELFPYHLAIVAEKP